MSALDDLRRTRAERNTARAAFEARKEALKADLEERGIAGRIVDEVSEQARELTAEAIDVVEHHPGVVGGTIAALAVWLFRNPLQALLATAIEAGKETLED